MGFDLKDSVHLLRLLAKCEKELRKQKVLGEYDHILLSKAANFIEEAIDNSLDVLKRQIERRKDK